MTLTKAIIIFVLLVIAFNLFFYARFKRLMAEVKRRVDESENSVGQEKREKNEDENV